MTMDASSSANLKLISEIFYNIATGIGTLFAGFAGFIGLREYFKYRHIETIKNKLRRLYPREKLNKTFKLVDTEKKRGKIYLVDLEKKEKYWIASGSTFTDLNFYWDDRKTISQQEFDSYPEGNWILISERQGS